MRNVDVARVLSVLVRSDDAALEYFAVRTRTATKLSTDDLRWWRGFLEQVVDHLEHSDVDALRAYRLVLEGARSSRRHTVIPATEPVISTEPRPHRGWDAGTYPMQGAPIRSAPSPSPWLERTAEEPEGDMEQTQLALYAPPTETILPFHGATGAPASAVDAESPDEHDVGETAAAELLVGMPLPFDNPAEALNLEAYAALCAEEQAAEDGEARERARHRHRVADPAARARLEAAWDAALSADPELQERFAILVARHREHLTRRP